MCVYICRSQRLCLTAAVCGLYVLSHYVGVMFSKPVAKDANVPATREFAVTAGRFFLDNKLSSADAADLFEKASALDTTGALNEFKKLRRTLPTGKRNKNLCRDLTRRLLKRCPWPEPSMAKVPCWSNKQQKIITLDVPILLPHRIIAALATRNALTTLLKEDVMDSDTKQHLEKVRLKLQDDKVLAIGLWIDGVPYNNNRLESLEVFSMNLCGLDNMRVPLAAIPKKYMAADNITHDAVLEIISWSLEQCILGVHPYAGPAGVDLSPKEKQLSGHSFPKAAVCEVRGDWACFKSAFRLPGWQEKAGCCWRCTCTPAEVSQVSSQASWRQPESRLTHWDVLQRIIDKGHTLCPLFNAPFVDTTVFRIDWLHCADLGITLEFLASFFLMILPKMGKRKEDLNCSELYLLMKEFYTRTGCASRLDTLKPSMLKKQKGKSATLRAKAGESRALVPFVLELCQKLTFCTPEEQTAVHAATALAECYQCLSADVFNIQKIEIAARKFATQYCALNAFAKQQGLRRWQVKPKLHLFLELTQCSSSPALTWTYRDEDFGGHVAKVCKRLAGLNSPRTVGLQLLSRFRAKSSLSVA